VAKLQRVLVVGSGGREHALAERLLASESIGEVIVTPGNAGSGQQRASIGKVVRNAAGNPRELARAEHVDLVVVGPEAPLCDGLVDELSADGILAYGPSRLAAQLEGSKAFMKAFAERHGLRTARHRVVENVAELDSVLAEFPTPPVVKADGLCGGKGVVVAATHEEALSSARSMLEDKRFGAAGARVVIEERIEGAEVSAHAICDGERLLVLPPAQDHKRIGDRDTGPNTGGMGTYAPTPVVTAELLQRIEREVLEPAVLGMARDGVPFRGTLFAGLMVTPAGEPVLLEFNVRFGDPETQVMMDTVDGDLGLALSSAARGRLDPSALKASGRHAVCVVLAAAGYPGTPRSGDPIEGLDQAESVDGVRVYHAGTTLDAGRVVTAGGRVLGVTAVADQLALAHARAYRAVEHIRFDGMQYRRDIAARALSRPASP
jgi:phosphoribosylamine---glycine ligase